MNDRDTLDKLGRSVGAGPSQVQQLGWTWRWASWMPITTAA